MTAQRHWWVLVRRPQVSASGKAPQCPEETRQGPGLEADCTAGRRASPAASGAALSTQPLVLSRVPLPRSPPRSASSVQ